MIDERDLHRENPYAPISVTESGIEIDERLLHRSKALRPIFTTELGMVTDVRLLHPSKALPPICTTDSGISMDARSRLPLNAPSPLSVTDSGAQARKLDREKCLAGTDATLAFRMIELYPLKWNACIGTKEAARTKHCSNLVIGEPNVLISRCITSPVLPVNSYDNRYVIIEIIEMY